MIKKGCAIAAVILLGLFGGYLYLLWGRIETLPALILAGFGAIGLVMVVSQLKAVIFGSGDSGALKRAEQGLPLEDGREEAVWGPIEPLGAALEAPFSGRPCVAYEYDAKNPSMVDSRGHERPGGPSPDWALLAHTAQQARLTLVIYMGMSGARPLQEGLLQGLSADTPVAVIQHASLPQQRHATATLDQLADTIAHEGLGSPSVIVVGEVLRGLAALHGQSARNLTRHPAA